MAPWTVSGTVWVSWTRKVKAGR